MSYISTIPENRIAPLAWLGKSNWLTPKKRGYSYSRQELQTLLNSSLKFGKEFANQVRQIINLSVSPDIQQFTGLDSIGYSHLFFMASKVLASGQKTICLTTGWCEAFENTELTLQFREYRQPFPTMVVELPIDYVKTKRVPQISDYPEYVAVHLDEGQQVLLVEICLRKSHTHLLIPFTPDYNLEAVLKELVLMPSDEADYSKAPDIEKYLAQFIRIALNAVIAMIYGADWHKLEPTYLDKQAKERLKAQTTSNDIGTARKARLRLAALPEIYEFDQTTKAFLEEPLIYSDISIGVSGMPKKPHWRRGHWRRQPVGPGRQERELRWIRPTLIHADRFKGDLKDTTTTYATK